MNSRFKGSCARRSYSWKSRTLLLVVSFTLKIWTTKALQQPATSFYWSDGGSKNDILITEAYYTSNISTDHQIKFRSISWTETSTINTTVLSSDSISSSLSDLPFLTIQPWQGWRLYSSNSLANTVTPEDYLWLITYPLNCAHLSRTLDIFSYKRGQGNWTSYSLDTSKFNESAYAVGHYLGAGFVYEHHSASKSNVNATSIYNFGGLCIGSTDSRGNTTAEAFSDTILRLDNIATLDGDSTTLQLEAPKSKPAPIPEAGFSWNVLPSNPTFSNIDGSQTAVLIGGYTSNSRFIGLGQLAAYTVPSEEWSFINIDQSTLPDGTTPRAGHTAILSADGSQMIVYGGWINNLYTAAEPQLLILNIGNYGKGWSWTAPLTTGNIPSMGLWGHTAILLEGNVMLVSSGFIMQENTTQSVQTINTQTFYYNISSGSWLYNYTYAHAEDTRPMPSKSKDIIILVSIFGGLFTLFIFLLLITLFYQRYHRYHNISQTVNDEQDKRAEMLQVHDDHDTAPTIPAAVLNRRSSSEQSRRIAEQTQLLASDLYVQGSPHSSGKRSENNNSSKRMSKIAREHDMMAWIRSWGNRDLEAVDAAVIDKYKRFAAKIRPPTINESAENVSQERGRGTSSSHYSSHPSTLTSSEIYDIDYPVPPPLLSDQQSPRHAGLVAGPSGVIRPLPRRMATEFAQPTIIPRDSAGASSYTSYLHSGSTFGSARPIFPRESIIEPNLHKAQASDVLRTSLSPTSASPRAPSDALKNRMKSLRNSAGPGTFEIKTERTSANILSPETYTFNRSASEPQPPKPGRFQLPSGETEIERLRRDSETSLLAKERKKGKKRAEQATGSHYGAISIPRSSFQYIKERGASFISFARSTPQPEPAIIEEPSSSQQSQQQPQPQPRSFGALFYGRIQRAKDAYEAEISESTPALAPEEKQPEEEEEDNGSPMILEEAHSVYSLPRQKLRVVNVTPSSRQGSGSTIDSSDGGHDIQAQGEEERSIKIVKKEDLMNREGKAGVGLGIAL